MTATSNFSFGQLFVCENCTPLIMLLDAIYGNDENTISIISVPTDDHTLRLDKESYGDEMEQSVRFQLFRLNLDAIIALVLFH